jgi:hypothetical protein
MTNKRFFHFFSFVFYIALSVPTGLSLYADDTYRINDMAQITELSSSNSGEWQVTDTKLDPKEYFLLWKSQKEDLISWKPYTVPNNLSKIFPTPFPNGYTVYIKKEFVLPENWDSHQFSISFRRISDSDRTYLNGKLIGSTGTFGTNKPQAVFKSRIYDIPKDALLKGQKNLFLMEVQSYFDHSMGIMLDEIKFGPSAIIYQELESKEGYKIFFCIIYLIMGLLFLFVFSFRRTNKEYFFYSIFNLLFSFYQFLLTQKYYEFPIPYEFFWNSVYIVIPFLFITFNQFLLKYFQLEYSKLNRGLDYILYANVVYVLFQWNLNIASKIWLRFGVFLCLFYLLIISYHIFKKVLQKNRDAIYIGYSFLFLIPATGIDIISNFGFFKLPQVLSPIFFLFFIVSLSIILTLNIEKMRRSIEDLNVNLEEKVTKRTHELHSSLENIRKLKSKEDNLHYIIGTSLKDSVSEIKELSYNLLHQEFISSNEMVSVMNEIHKDSEEVFESLEDIITWTKLQTGLIQPKKEKVELKEFLSQLISSIPSPPNHKKISITSYIDENYIQVDSTLLGFVLKKILSIGSITALANGNLKLTGKGNSGGIEIEISMEKMGISKEKWEENWKVNHDTLGTSQNREKVNLGAIILPQYLELLHAIYKVEEESSELLKITIQIPNCLVG